MLKKTQNAVQHDKPNVDLCANEAEYVLFITSNADITE